MTATILRIYPPITAVVGDVFGEPQVRTGRLIAVTIEGEGQLHIKLIEPGNREPSYLFFSYFPACAVLLMWGEQSISLSDLPPRTITGPRTHCPSFAPLWKEVARRCRATNQLWFDAVEATIAVNTAFQRELARR